MALTEPITTLTDYAIALVAFILASSLGRISWQKQQYSIGLWAIAFACVALAAALGGTCHGFMRVLEAAWLIGLWQGMVYLLSFASLTLLIGSILGTVPAKEQRWLLCAIGVKSSLTWFILLQMPQFEWAALDYGASLLIVLLLQLRSLLKRRTPSAPGLIGGILVSGGAMAILISRFSLPPMLVASDLYHLVQLIGLGLLYQGAKQLRDQVAIRP